MRPIWFAGFCAGALVLLTIVGERTLPLFGGDVALAERTYKTLYMVLITGVVAGVIPWMYARVARFARFRLKETGQRPTTGPMMVRFFETAGPWFAALVGVGGLGLAAYIWFFDA